MAGSIQPTASGLNMVAFMTGVNADGTLNVQNGWSWNNNSANPQYNPADGGAHSFGAGTVVTWGLNPDYAWSASEIRYTQQAFAAWSAIANVTFNKVDYAAAAVKYNRPTTGGADAGADDYDAGTPGSTTIPRADAGTINVTRTGTSYGTIDSYLVAGGYGPSTVVHEIGHVLGLMHSGTYNGAVVSSRDQFSAEDTYKGSIMSYIPPEDDKARYYQPGTDWEASDGNTYVAQSPMQYDVLAIQRLYGLPQTSPLLTTQTFGFHATSGLDVYDFTILTHPVTTIWSNATGNTLDLSGFATASVVDLNPGAFSSADDMTNNIAIAFDTRVDRAVGGAGDDIFTLNLFNDSVDGGAGANTVVMPGTLAQYSFGFANDAVTAVAETAAAGGTSTLVNVQTLRFSDGTTTPMAALPHRIDITDTVTSISAHDDATAYSGPVNYLEWQYIWSSPDAVAMRSNAPNAFLKGGAAGDALQATSGSNVLDGGLGSNFLVGATGSDGGVDTFFADARGGGTTWSTAVNFHRGDMATIWGYVGGTSTFSWSDGDGAAGYTGATIHASTAGSGPVDASMTFAGIAMSDAASKFTITTGGVGGDAYMLISYTG